jgi:hypothetical protein
MSTPDSHPPSNPPPELGRARTWVVDGANVIGSRPDGWWRDRAGAAQRLRGQIANLLDIREPGHLAAHRLPDQVILVLEGAARSGVPATAPASPAAAGTEFPPGPADRPRSDEPNGNPPERSGSNDRREPALVVVHAPGSGDDTVTELAATAPRPVVVFTSDRGLRDRVKAVGGDVAGAGALTRLLAGPRGPSTSRS